MAYFLTQNIQNLQISLSQCSFIVFLYSFESFPSCLGPGPAPWHFARHQLLGDVVIYAACCAACGAASAWTQALQLLRPLRQATLRRAVT
jgi:hypothetical protein